MSTGARKKPRKTDLRQDRFPYEYFIDFNGKQAAIRCGYSPKTAEAQASRLLRKSKVAAKLKELQETAKKKALKTAEDWEREIDLIAFFRGHRGFYKEDGTLKGVNELTDEQLALVNEIEHSSIGGGKDKPLIRVTNLKLYDKLKALDMKAKRLGLYKDAGTEHLVYTFEKWLDTIRAVHAE